MTNKQKQLIEDVLIQIEYRENDFPVVSDLSELPKKYKGLAVEINDHGNVTVYNVFKNGNCREIASCV